MGRLSMLAWVSGLCLTLATSVPGDEAEWIWAPGGNPAESAPKGTVYFRRVERVDQPSTCQLRLVVDDSFVLWVNGKKIGEGHAGKPHRFNLNGVVSEGMNVFVIEAKNESGRAGLLIKGVIRDQGGGERAIDSGNGWKVTATAPTGDWRAVTYDDSKWTPAAKLGKHADSPWKDIDIAESYLDRYWLADGLEIERIGEPTLAGSLVAMTWGNRGRLLVSQERGPIISLVDSDNDGKYDQAIPYTDQMKNCQGLCVVGKNLYAVGEGPQDTGLYLLPDENQDDKADSCTRLIAHKGGIGEHGPHAVVLGPDGWLYHCIGNHANIKPDAAPESACRGYIEGYLLTPKFEDGRGHAAGIKAPGGQIWRFTPDAKKWWLETNGFRNEYDFAIDQAGEIFAFDSDMEWDIGEPWYRPVRVNHCTVGAEFGWRSGAAKWPDYYYDSLPSMVDIGRGSPTGVTIYEHTQLPELFQGSVLLCDWSMGRIIASKPKPAGATYDGRDTINVITGNPLNVSDIDVAPDGSIVFTTGGRNTEGGVYRISAAGAKRQAAKAESVKDLLALPQISTAWARELVDNVKAKSGPQFETELQQAAKTGTPAEKIRALTILSQAGPAPSLDLLCDLSKDASPDVRAFATWLLSYHPDPKTGKALAERLADSDKHVQRRALESFIRSGQEPPVEPLMKLMGDDDRFLRFTARLAIERVPVEKWKSAALASKNDQVRVHALLSLHRLGKDAIDPNEVAKQVSVDWERGSTAKIELLRLLELAIIDGAKEGSIPGLSTKLLAAYPTGNFPIDREISRIVCFTQTPGASEKLLAILEKSENQQEQVHLALCLKYLDEGWNTDLKTRYIRWYETSKSLDGGHSFVPYLENIVSGSFHRLTPEERKTLIADWKDHPFAARLLIRRNNPDTIGDFPALMTAVIAESDEGSTVPYAGEIYDLCLDALGRHHKPESQAILRKLFDENPDRRDRIALKLSEHVVPENRPYYVQSLSFASNGTLPFVVRALDRLKTKPEKPEELRQAILAGLKLGEGAKVAVELLKDWTGQKPPGDDILQNMAFYQEYFAKTHPTEPKAELPKLEAAENKYSFDQLLDYLEAKPEGRQGDPSRGKLAYTKALCIKCHKFGTEGQGIGPDLTSLRRRFQRKEIIEAIVYPSQVVSDQYKSVTVLTTEGVVQTGMLAAQQGQENVVLWLNNGERLEIPKDDIEEQKPATTSLMPPNLLKDLTLQEIADLFAFLETSKTNPEPGQDTRRAGAGGK